MITVAEFAELAEPGGYRYELRRGVVVGSRSPSVEHQWARAKLCAQLLAAAPRGMVAIAGLEVELGPAEPGTVRRPDIVVIDDVAFRRVEDEQTFLRAAEVRLAVEIESADSAHTDRVVKRAEYARAGIARYWLVDIDAPISVLPMHLTAEFGYVEDGEVTGVCTIDGAFAARLRLDELAR